MEIEEENSLERLLRLAADEPAHRPEFSTVLLESTVYVLSDAGSSVEKDEIRTLKAGSNVSIQSWNKDDGTAVIPFFSSLEVLQKSIEDEQSYLALPARSLFEITLGATLVLNPRSDYGKEYIPDEVKHLLSTGLNQELKQRVVEKETKVLLGQPSNYPSKMVDSLIQLLAKHKNVKKGYLALMHDTSVDEKPHLVIGIEADGDIELVIREAGSVAGESTPDGEPVDLIRVSLDDDGLSQYFINETKPFYECSWGSKMSSFFGSGKA